MTIGKNLQCLKDAIDYFRLPGALISYKQNIACVRWPGPGELKFFLRSILDAKFWPSKIEVEEKESCWRKLEVMDNRVFHFYTFFELSLVLLTTHAIGLYEVTKKTSFAKSDRFRTQKNGTSSGQIKILRPLL